MKPKPILFSGAMVRAILAGEKTQTRRVVKDPRRYGLTDERMVIGHRRNLPYVVGQILWVRETFNADWCDHVIYRADGGAARDAGYSAEPRWRPSIFMPRSSSRITLRVTDVRVERLQGITVHDIRLEGIGGPAHDGPGPRCSSECSSLRLAWATAWDSLNAKRGHGWEKNPWVWVVSFRRLSP